MADPGGHWIVCPTCAAAWAGTIDPRCPLCRGAGVLILGRLAAVHDPRSVARAVSMHLAGLGSPLDRDVDDYRRSMIDRKAAELDEAGFVARLPADVAEDDDLNLGAEAWPEGGDRNAVGRLAGDLLRAAGMRPPRRSSGDAQRAREMAAVRAAADARRRAEGPEVLPPGVVDLTARRRTRRA